jgi:hypothetical protein
MPQIAYGTDRVKWELGGINMMEGQGRGMPPGICEDNQSKYTADGDNRAYWHI